MTFRATTQGVEVTAEPEFSPERSDPDAIRYFWTYTITLRNTTAQRVQLLTRHWDIVDETGARQAVDGPGVVGEQPILAPGEQFRYTSGVPLATPSGVMRGRYGMRGEDGTSFDVEIPAFSLDSPHADRSVN
ncbi:Co2+/Mg2+ efflux protein ApaG [Tepidamorphus sp. 3E244]|uniref:Co2+/Mg2+ efflux protein ApaG n=1 Tax=Tepidamorphus sp. 3E244 TaxID=3385498 RepID=UPI0038FD2408